MLYKRDTAEYQGPRGTAGFNNRLILFIPHMLLFFGNFFQIMFVDTLREWKTKRPIRKQVGYLYYQGFLFVWVPFLYGYWLGYLLIYVSDGGNNQGGLVGALMIWGIMTTFVYLVARITAMRCMPFTTIAVPLFSLQVASDLFTEMVFIDLDIRQWPFWVILFFDVAMLIARDAEYVFVNLLR